MNATSPRAVAGGERRHAHHQVGTCTSNTLRVADATEPANAAHELVCKEARRVRILDSPCLYAARATAALLQHALLLQGARSSHTAQKLCDTVITSSCNTRGMCSCIRGDWPHADCNRWQSHWRDVHAYHRPPWEASGCMWLQMARMPCGTSEWCTVVLRCAASASSLMCAASSAR